MSQVGSVLGRSAVALLVLFVAVGPTAAQSGHDERLADAAARIVAENIGPLRTNLRRGGSPRLFDNSAQTAIGGSAVRTGDPASRRPRPGEWHRGLALAVEGRRTVSPEL